MRYLWESFLITCVIACEGDCEVPRKFLKATILSADQQRFDATRTVLSPLFEVKREVPLSINDPALFRLISIFKTLRGRNFTASTPDRERKAFSNFLAFHEAIWSHAWDKRTKSDGWRFFFEDDVALHPNVTSPLCNIMHGIEIARSDGILYLGLCAPRCILWDIFRSENKGLDYQKCSGTCAHAFGLTKWKAQSILELMQVLRQEYHKFDEQVYFDIGLFSYGKRVNPVWTVGANLSHAPPRNLRNKKFVHYKANHIGMFFQNREQFPSTIG